MRTHLQRLVASFAIDTRSLAAFRVGLGAVVLLDLATRASALTAHYTDDGVLPRGALLMRPFDEFHLSLLMLSGDRWFAATIFLLAAGSATALLLGVRARIAAFSTWLLYATIVSRNEMVLQGSDTVLRVLLFWSLFLPVGIRFSVDRLCVKADRPVPRELTSVATAALLVQVAFIFWFGGLLKTAPEWWPDLTAVYYAIHWDELATPFTRFLRGFPGPVLQALTLGVLTTELLAPLVLFSPLRRDAARVVGLGLLTLMLLGFTLSFRLGVWPWAAIVALLPFLPGGVWDRLGPLPERAKPSRHLVSWIRARLGPVSTDPSPSRVTSLVAAPLLAYVLLWNLATVSDAHLLPREAWRLGSLLRIDQEWNMFAPGPRTYGGWWVVTGRDADGALHFLLPEGAYPGWDRPPWPADVYEGHRWRLYMWQLWFRARSPYRIHFARFLCRRENAVRTGGERLEQVDVFYMKEPTLPGNEIPPAEPVHVLRHRCDEPQ